MRDLILLGVGIGIGYWYCGRSAEQARLKKENELLMRQLKDKKDN